MIKNVRHPGIKVGNLAKALHFYKDALGLKVVSAEGLTPYFAYIFLRRKQYTCIKLETENGDLIELLHDGSRVKPSKYNHISFTVDKLDKVYDILKDIYGVKFNTVPTQKGLYLIAFCKDFEGNLVELVEELERKSKKW